MSENNAKITETEKNKYHLQNLSNRPNAMSSYREGKLSAADLKKLFDERFDFLADKHNVVVDDEQDLYDLYGDLNAALAALLALSNQISSTTVVMWEGDVNSLLDRMYPVGSIYITMSEELPANLFGGNWIKIEDRFLLASGTNNAGTEGGSEDHIHSLDNVVATYIPHTQNSDGVGGEYWQSRTVNLETKPNQWTASAQHYYGNAGEDVLEKKYDSEGNANGDSHRVGTALFGEMSRESSIPPYLAVHIWQRLPDDAV